MEATLAAYGSGAAKTSHDTGRRLLVVDVGGGTTKLAVVDRGQVVATAAVHIGGRLLVTGADGRLMRIDPAGRRHAARAGYTWRAGDIVEPHHIERVAELMAATLLTLLTAERARAGTEWPHLTGPLPDFGAIDGVVFSGGVAEYVYDRETRDFGDLGRPLGRALRRRLDDGALPWPLLPPGECIRATALGASEYSVQLSGNTGCVTDPGALLPRRDLPVVRPRYDLGQEVDSGAIAAAVRRRLAETGTADSGVELVLALSWKGPPAHQRVLALALGVRDGMAERIAGGLALYIVLDGDVAMTLGRVLRDELGITVPLLVVDGLALRDFDHIDLGRLRYPSNTVPVTIKSLVFHDEPAAG
jgi:ethanolamine utilization protein EutA